jgi:glycerophosphoryl diester phosphodiesterase
MRIIAHRGASGLELENSLAALSRAVELKVDGVEFDVRLTKDRQLVLCHDASLRRVTDSNARVADLTLTELRKIKLKNGENIPTLEEALEVLGSTWALIEPKVDGCAEDLLNVIDKFPQARISITTFKRQLVRDIKHLRPEQHVFASEHHRPIMILDFIEETGADGLSIYHWIMNPLTYYFARKRKVDIFIWTVDSRWRVWLLHKLYPAAAICTNRPERFIKTAATKD